MAAGKGILMGKTGKVGLAAALTMAAVMGAEAEKRPKLGVKTDKEGMKKYLLRQAELAKQNKPSKKKLKKSMGKKRSK